MKKPRRLFRFAGSAAVACMVAGCGALAGGVEGGGGAAMEYDNGFAFDLYAQLAKGKGNIFYSPLSVSVAMGMAYEGAKGETAAEIGKVLRLDAGAVPLPPPLENFTGPDKVSDGAVLEFANAAWAQQGFNFQASYIDILSKKYQADFNKVDFAADPEKVRGRINAWVAEKTHEKIKDLIASGVLNNMTRLVLTNAIYLKALWMNQFKEQNTAKAPFFTDAEKSVETSLMKQTGSFAYAEDDDVQVVELDYKGTKRLAMMVILPRRKDGLAAVEAKLAAVKYTAWAAAMKHRRVELSLPKFKSECSFSLNNMLMAMGVREAFNEKKADFSGIDGEKDLFISAVIHKAFVAVEEKGTEAAAATAVVMTLKSAPMRQEEPVVFKADHPFLYLIREKTSGTILFLGRLSAPE